MKRLRCPHCGYFRLIMNEDEFLECQECGWYEDPDREDEEDGGPPIHVKGNEPWRGRQ